MKPLNDDEIELASTELFKARRDFQKLSLKSSTSRPLTVKDAYRVQEKLVNKLLKAEQTTKIGYKIGATNPAAREMLGANEQFSGNLLASYSYPSSKTIYAKDYHVIVLEPEIAIKLNKDLGPINGLYTPETAAKSVGAVAPAIEIVTSPFPVWNEAGICNIIADNAANGAWIYGDFIEYSDNLDLKKQNVSLTINGTIQRNGSGSNVDGGPLIVLAWLANFLLDNGQMLKAGDTITTGSTTLPFQAGSQQHVIADFGILGECILSIK